MREIENKMCEAIRERMSSTWVKDKSWSLSNTRVDVDVVKGGDNIVTVYLHGHNICIIEGNKISMSSCGWTTNTTKSRLNALANMFMLPTIYQKNHEWYLSRPHGTDPLVPHGYLQWEPGSDFSMPEIEFYDGMTVSDLDTDVSPADESFGRFLSMFSDIHEFSKIIKVGGSGISRKIPRIKERDLEKGVESLDKLGKVFDGLEHVSSITALMENCRNDPHDRALIKKLFRGIYPKWLQHLGSNPKGDVEMAVVFGARYMTVLKAICKRIDELITSDNEEFNCLMACAMLSDKKVGLG